MAAGLHRGQHVYNGKRRVSNVCAFQSLLLLLKMTETQCRLKSFPDECNLWPRWKRFAGDTSDEVTSPEVM